MTGDSLVMALPASVPATDPVCASAHNTNAKSRFRPKKVASRQSGEVGVTWNGRAKVWVARYYLNGKQKSQSFSTSQFLTEGMTWEAADKKALQAAKRFRQNALQTTGAKSLKKITIPQSGIIGVWWISAMRAWKVNIYCTPDGDAKKQKRSFGTTTDEKHKRKQIFGGYFKPKDDTAEARDVELQKAKDALAQLYKRHMISYVTSSD